MHDFCKNLARYQSWHLEQVNAYQQVSELNRKNRFWSKKILQFEILQESCQIFARFQILKKVLAYFLGIELASNEK